MYIDYTGKECFKWQKAAYINNYTSLSYPIKKYEIFHYPAHYQKIRIWITNVLALKNATVQVSSRPNLSISFPKLTFRVEHHSSCHNRFILFANSLLEYNFPDCVQEVCE